MKKPLLLFIIAVIVLIVAKLAYTKFCNLKNENCKNSTTDYYDGSPEEGVDW